MSYVFDLERSARGFQLNRFLHRLVESSFRDFFKSEPEKAMEGLSEREMDMVRRLDWKAMQDHGANFFCLEKLARVRGVSNPEMVAAFRGETLEQFLKTRRVPGGALTVKALLGDYPVTKRFKDTAKLDFAKVELPQHAFKRVVRDLEFDVAELAIVTYLLAKAHGKPYRLLPAVVTARFQHPFLVSTKKLKPRELEGKRIGQRSYSVTTATWVRGILQDDYGVDLDKVQWVTFEDPHVAEFRDPANVERAPAGEDMTQMLLAGELDAAIVGDAPKDPRIRPLIEDLDGAAAAWRRRTGASIQINHMVTVKQDVSRDVSSSIYASLLKSRNSIPDGHPFGIEENRRNLEAAIDCVYRQDMIPRRFTVEELFE